jgi:hypothetical protein
MTHNRFDTPEFIRLAEDASRTKNWKRWGPYLPERQWGTVREDYSEDGDAWRYFPFEHSDLRAYRWGADGLLGITDRKGRLCFNPCLWNEKDSILKERLFGLSGHEGNHGEDCKELYYYLDSTPTHSYSKALYKYPHAAFPYEKLRSENKNRGIDQPEYELLDTGVFDENRYFDFEVEYAKGAPNDLLIRLTVTNQGSETAPIVLLPKIWYRNTWSWGCEHEGCTLKPQIASGPMGQLDLNHSSLGKFHLAYEADMAPELGFSENETDTETLYQTSTYTPHTRSAFTRWIRDGSREAVHSDKGTMAMLRYRFELKPGESQTIRLRLFDPQDVDISHPLSNFDTLFQNRKEEADQFWDNTLNSNLNKEERELQRQAYAGLLWSKQFYHYSVSDWLKGDSGIAHPPEARLKGRNNQWSHLYNRDVISMPDKWEYPWYASWDLAFHMVPFAKMDPAFAKSQLILFLREWYMHPNGQIPAYEWALDDVNPPTHAWACWQVYRIEARKGEGDVDFLKRVFSKLLLNFTWWVNRKDPEGNNLFGGGFLGLDNIGLFDRSKPLPEGATLHQADGTSWMAFYCTTMMEISLELARFDPSYEDIASKFFEHFMSIADAINHFGEDGLWDSETRFYYDEIHFSNGHSEKVKARSLVGLLPLIAVLPIEMNAINALPGFRKRMDWYLEHRKDITTTINCQWTADGVSETLLLAIPTEDRLRSVLGYLFDEDEFLSPYGIRSLSKVHEESPYSLKLDGDGQAIRYCAGDSDTWLFGGNSNWRGPIWFPLNYLLIESIKRFGSHYGDRFTIEYPTGSGVMKTLDQCANDIENRLKRLFFKDENGRRPYNNQYPQLDQSEDFGDYHQFFEFFNGDTGQGHGASHQTGWTALIATILDQKQ